MRSLRKGARLAATRLRLPLKSQLWRGAAGNWAGAGRGSSLDFQDHRPYLPGDDPRHINWQAYARTGSYSMKLYREEVNPLVDLVLDASTSMSLDDLKRNRALELLLFGLDSAEALGASVRVFAIRGALAASLSPVEVVAGNAPLPGGTGSGRISLAAVPLRAGSLRVIVSDCLVADRPAALLGPLVSARGRAVVLAPHSPSESQPSWEGQVELLDCETGEKRHRRVDAALLERYRGAYRRHFEIWRQESRRHGAVFAQVPCEGGLVAALQAEALREGAVELAS